MVFFWTFYLKNYFKQFKQITIFRLDQKTECLLKPCWRLLIQKEVWNLSRNWKTNFENKKIRFYTLWYELTWKKFFVLFVPKEIKCDVIFLLFVFPATFSMFSFSQLPLTVQETFVCFLKKDKVNSHERNDRNKKRNIVTSLPTNLPLSKDQFIFAL
jgi:hypothetical protein